MGGFVDRLLFGAGVVATLTSCGGGTFGGSSKATTAKAQDASKAPPSEVAQTPDVSAQELPESLQAAAPQKSQGPAHNGDAPGELHDVTQTGFQCPKDMNLATGAWSGTYKGTAIANVVPVEGTVAFTMHPGGPSSLQVGQLALAGGLFGGDQVRSVAIDFQMNCGDLALHDAIVSFLGKKIHVKLAFAKEGWNPPTFQGTWIAQTELIPLEVARGTWSVAKK